MVVLTHPKRDGRKESFFEELKNGVARRGHTKRNTNRTSLPRIVKNVDIKPPHQPKPLRTGVKESITKTRLERRGAPKTRSCYGTDRGQKTREKEDVKGEERKRGTKSVGPTKDEKKGQVIR